MMYILFIFYVGHNSQSSVMATAEFANSTMCEEAASAIKQVSKNNQTLCLPKGK